MQKSVFPAIRFADGVRIPVNTNERRNISVSYFAVSRRIARKTFDKEFEKNNLLDPPKGFRTRSFDIHIHPIVVNVCYTVVCKIVFEPIQQQIAANSLTIKSR